MESAGKFVYKTSCELLILPYSAIVHFEADGNIPSFIRVISRNLP